MGNVKSRIARRKKEEYGHPLPPELLYEITKFIPLTRFAEHKIVEYKKKKKPKTDLSEMFIGPENVKLLQCNSTLATFLRIRCNQILQMINNVNNDYFYEVKGFPILDEKMILISRKGTNRLPLTMFEMLRHVCFCRKFDLKYKPILISKKHKTMPIDFKNYSLKELYNTLYYIHFSTIPIYWLENDLLNLLIYSIRIMELHTHKLKFIMGNIINRITGRKYQKFVRSLPPELLYEITKFIPLTRFEEHKMMEYEKKKDGPIQFIIDIKDGFFPKKKECKWQLPKMFIGPENVKLLQCNSILTKFLRIRCNRILQIIEKVNNEYIYEEFEYLPTWSYNSKLTTIISRKGTNYRPLTMCEIMRHICFCRKFEFKLHHIILSQNLNTMPTDFKPDYFVDFLIGFSERTPHPEMISKCIIYLNEQQGKNALKTLKKYRSAQRLCWRNWHKPKHKYRLKLRKENDKFIFIFSTLYYRLPEYF